MQISTPQSAEQLDQTRALMRAFVAWHRERHVEDAHLIDAYFDAKAFEEELATLPGVYAPRMERCSLQTAMVSLPAVSHSGASIQRRVR
jgi:hypothetical protein